MKSMYRHDPLADAKKQIRLLRFLSEPRYTGGISLQLQTYDLACAPPFNAISYVWGPESERQVLINGLPFIVRESCRYALYQARKHYPLEYIWIDSVCIDQKNKAEKGFQVTLMWTIYCQAAHVLDCLGPHQDDSKYIARCSKQIQQLWAQWKWHRILPSYIPGDILSTDWGEAAHNSGIAKVIKKQYGDVPLYWSDEWVDSLSDKDFARMTKAYDKLARRGYWYRLWITQELAAACQPDKRSTRLRFLCGDDDMHRGVLDLLPSLVRRGNKTKYNSLEDRIMLEGHIYNLDDLRSAIAMAGKLELENILRTFKNYGCTDPRDRLYGILGLVDWKSHGIESTPPDYGLSNFQLAEKLCRFVDLKYVSDVLTAMRVECTQPEMQEIIKMRALRTRHGMDRQRTTLGEESTPVVDYVRAQSLLVNHQMLRPLEEIGCGRLEFRQLGENDYFPSTTWSIVSEGYRHAQPKCLTTDDGVVAWIMCSAAEPGDMLVEFKPLDEDMEDPGMGWLYLVLRHEHGDEYSVVGQALRNAWDLDNLDDRLLNQTHAKQLFPHLHLMGMGDLKLRLTKEDAIVILGQDFRLQKNHAERPITGVTREQWKLAKLTRLFLNPVTDPISAAIYTSDSTS